MNRAAGVRVLFSRITWVTHIALTSSPSRLPVPSKRRISLRTLSSKQQTAVFAGTVWFFAKPRAYVQGAPRAVPHHIVRGIHEAGRRSKLAGDRRNCLSGHRSAACCMEESRSPKRCCTSITLHTKVGGSLCTMRS